MIREIVVFISYENERPPAELAQEMVRALGIGRAELGVDLLTAACEVRLYYDPVVAAGVMAWLAANQVVHDVNYL